MNLFTASMVLIAACGGSGAPSIDELPQAVADAICATQAACGYADSVAACEASLTLDNFELETIIADVKAGVVIYDADQAQACFDAADTSCRFTGLHQPDDDPCSTYLVGTVATGGACFYSQECAGGAQCTVPCDNDAMCCAGTCGAPMPGKAALGGTCTFTSDCAEDAYCKRGGAQTGTCTAVVTTEGAACDDIFACANPMACSTFGSGGTCMVPAASGATCRTDLGLAEASCVDERDYCDPTSKKCVPRLEPGTACTADDLCAGGECTGGTCRSVGQKGAACDQSDAPNCALGLSCESGVCTAEPSGTSCR